MQRNQPLNPIEKFVAGREIPKNNRHPGQWIEKLCLQVRVDRHAAEGVGIPKRQYVFPHTPRNVSNQRQMKSFNVVRDRLCWVNQDGEKKDNWLRNQHKQAERFGGRQMEPEELLMGRIGGWLIR